MTRPGRHPMGGRRRRLRALVSKETKQIARDPSSMLIAFVLPLILLFVFGYGVSLDANRKSLGIVLEASSPSARELASAFAASPFFSVRMASDRRELGAALARGAIVGILVVPARFDADLRQRSGAPELQLILDGADPNTASLVRGYAQGVLARWRTLRAVEAGRRAPEIGVEDRMWFNAARTSRHFLVPGAIAIVMALTGTLLTSLVIAREWERGTMEALIATPVTVPELLLAKAATYFVLGLLSMTLCLVIALAVFHVPFRGSLLALYSVSGAFLLPALGQGLLISAATKNQFLASQLALISSFLPTFLMSGFLFEIGSMPKPIQVLCQLISARWVVPTLQTVFLTGDLWPLFLESMAVLTIYALVFLALAMRATKKRVA